MDVSGGDAGIIAAGDTLEDAFKDAALGMYGLMTDLEGVREAKRLKVSVEGRSIEGLLVSWLNELIFQFDAYGFVGKTIEMEEFGGNRLMAALRGEDFDPERHERRLLVKAATYHGLKVAKEDGRWRAEVIFDI